MGAAWASVIFISGYPRSPGATAQPRLAARWTSDLSTVSGSVCSSPMRIDATKAPASDPMPPTVR